VPASAVGWSGHRAEYFYGFSQFLQTDSGMLPLLGDGRFIPNVVPFNIRHPVFLCCISRVSYGVWQ